MSIGIVYENRLPRWVRAIGGKFRYGRKSYRMAWGELSFHPGWSVTLCLFGEAYSLHLGALWTHAYITLPFLQRWHREPEGVMEAWGASSFDGAVHISWGPWTKVLRLPWRDWTQTAHDVLRADGSWAPFVGSWERDKEPDGRHNETHPYRYLLRSGEKQERTATIYVERRRRKLRWLRWLPLARTRYAIDVAFNDEVGERTGSWKGGTIGCGYELRPDETPRECLQRMESERRF